MPLKSPLLTYLLGAPVPAPGQHWIENLNANANNTKLHAAGTALKLLSPAFFLASGPGAVMAYVGGTCLQAGLRTYAEGEEKSIPRLARNIGIYAVPGLSLKL